MKTSILADPTLPLEWEAAAFEAYWEIREWYLISTHERVLGIIYA